MSEQSSISNDVKHSRLAQDFIVAFVSKKDDLANQIQNLTNCNNIQEQFSLVAKEIQKLNKNLHDSITFLPSYSVKKRQEEIRHLEKLLKEKEDLLVPKRKFGFKSKVKLNPVPTKESKVSQDEKSRETELIAKNISSDTIKLDSNFVTIEEVHDQKIIYEEKDLNGADVLVRNIRGAIIELRGIPSTLRISGLKDCRLICGPVQTSIFVESCTDCKFYLCCQQLRTHSSSHLDIYLKVRARAIIEDCSDIRFAPYSYHHNKINEWHQAAGMDQQLERFDCVDDFNWLSADSSSPNWTIISEDQREQFPLIE